MIYSSAQELFEGVMMTAHDIENSTLNPLAKEFIPSSVTH